jgi:hypothetical protein
MNISFKPGLIVSIWLPGFALTAFLLIYIPNWNISELALNTWIALGIFAVSFVVGQFLDSARDALLENFLFERICGQVRWEFFFEADKELIAKLEEWYYMWYVLDANILIAIILAAILGLTQQIL